MRGAARPGDAESRSWPGKRWVAMGAMMGMTGTMGAWVLLWIMLALAVGVTSGIIIARGMRSRRATTDSPCRFACHAGSQGCPAAAVRQRRDQPGGLPAGQGRTGRLTALAPANAPPRPPRTNCRGTVLSVVA